MYPPMNFGSQALNNSCLLGLLALIGCTSFHRDTFLADHSLDKLLADRPESAALLSEYPLLKQWLYAQWNSPIGNYRIYWSDAPPAISMAEHGFMPDSKLIVIRLSDRLSAADQLTALCFEVCNAQAFSGVDALAAQAMARSISREEYIREKTEKEFHAVLRARGIIRERMPLSIDDQHATNLYRHLLNAPNEFDAYQIWNRRIPHSNYARTLQYYGKEYDQLANQRKTR